MVLGAAQAGVQRFVLMSISDYPLVIAWSTSLSNLELARRSGSGHLRKVLTSLVCTTTQRDLLLWSTANDYSMDERRLLCGMGMVQGVDDTSFR